MLYFVRETRSYKPGKRHQERETNEIVYHGRRLLNCGGKTFQPRSVQLAGIFSWNIFLFLFIPFVFLSISFGRRFWRLDLNIFSYIIISYCHYTSTPSAFSVTLTSTFNSAVPVTVSVDCNSVWTESICPLIFSDATIVGWP